MSDFQRVKDAIRIEAFIPGLKKAGRLFKACCPFHPEKTPSFVVNPDTQQWRCYGACARGGDVFDFVMTRDHLSYAEALTTLADHARVTLTPLTRSQAKAQIENARVNGLLTMVAELYHSALLSEAGAAVRTYLSETRGLTPATLAQWQIGYAPQSWQWLSEKLLALGYEEKELLDLGLCKKSEAGRMYDAFRHRVMFPIVDDRGQVRGFGGRQLNAEDTPKYLNSAQSDSFNKSALLYGLHRAKGWIRETGRVVVVEGYMDALQAHQSGFTNVVAQMGTAFTDAQREGLARHTSTVILALDDDEAGHAATLRAAEMHIKSGLDFRVLAVAGGKDPDDMIRATPDAWRAAAESSRSLVDMLINRESAALPQEANVLQRQIVQKRLAPLLTVPSNPAYTRENLMKLAQALTLPLEAPRPVLTVLPATAKAAPLPSPLELAVLHNLLVNDDERWMDRATARLRGVFKGDLPYALSALRPVDFSHPLTQRLMALICVAISQHSRPVHSFVEEQALGTDLEDLYARVYGLPVVNAVFKIDVPSAPRNDSYDAFINQVFRLRLSRLRDDMMVLSGLGDELSIQRWEECSRAAAYLRAALTPLPTLSAAQH